MARGGGMHGRVACMAGETSTAADGTHPTEMHSCIVVLVDVDAICQINMKKVFFLILTIY